LKNYIEVVATFDGSARADNEMTFISQDDIAYDANEEFVAIAEGKDIPFYIFTYNIEMTQFIYTDLMVDED
jgi:hypothetical protein